MREFLIWVATIYSFGIIGIVLCSLLDWLLAIDKFNNFMSKVTEGVDWDLFAPPFGFLAIAYLNGILFLVFKMDLWYYLYLSFSVFSLGLIVLFASVYVLFSGLEGIRNFFLSLKKR